MMTLDPDRLDLAAQYKANPLGPHGPELQQVLRMMHWDRAEARYICVQVERGGPWCLGRSRGGRGVALDLYRDHPYPSEAATRWAVFRKRWQQLTGVLPVVDPEDAVDPASGRVTPSNEVVRDTLIGYSDRFSVRGGESVAFMVSADRGGEFEAEIVRLRCGDAANVGFRHTVVPSPVGGTYPARRQPVHPGSYVQVAQAGPAGSFSLRALVWPTLPGVGEQCVLGWRDAADGKGFALGLDGQGAAAAWLGDGHSTQRLDTGTPLRSRTWYALAATVDTGRGEIWLAQAPLGKGVLDGSMAEASRRLEVVPESVGPVRLAAWSDSRERRRDGTARAFANFNGKLEAPAVYAGALPSGGRAGFLDEGAWSGRVADLFARWDFSRETSGTRIVDCSPNARHGETVNMPTRAMKGSAWDGSEYHWCRAPEQYAAIHFHDDDLHDCGWETDFRYDVPQDLPSGLYAAHLTHGELEDWIPFVVSPPVGEARAPLALLLPSASYWAYANRGAIIDYVGREHVRNAFTAADETALYLHHHPELGLSMYDTHNDGSGVCLSSRLRPIVSLRPDEALWQLPADTHLTDWLDEAGFAYDVLTEDDLDTHGASLLAPYRCLMTGTHPEYPSLAMMDAYAAFQARGGRFMYMGGNGFYWRVSFHPRIDGVMEMRRGEDGIRAWIAEGGEYYHAFTGELGGMWRRMGRAPQSVAGTGMTAQGFDRSTYYRRTPQSHDARVRFIFEGIGKDERIGDFGVIGGGAAGWEIDRADLALGTPAHTLVVARADTFTPAYHWMKEELTHTHAAVTGDVCPFVHCDMAFFETPNGGAVFSTSSIAWAGALAHDGYENNVARITANVLRRFLDPEPFAAPREHPSTER